MNKKGWLQALMMGIMVLSSQVFAQDKQSRVSIGNGQLYSARKEKSDTPSLPHIAREIKHELLTLPYYSLFDWLEYEVRPDSTVILRGQVVQPVTKSDAGGRVTRIEGVAAVVNEIEVLPLSPSDDRLRVALYRAIYGFNSPLFRYGTQVVPPIHLIVKNGRVTLKGVVATNGDRVLANLRARGVTGSFEIRNELQVEESMAR